MLVLMLRVTGGCGAEESVAGADAAAAGGWCCWCSAAAAILLGSPRRRAFAVSDGSKGDGGRESEPGGVVVGKV